MTGRPLLAAARHTAIGLIAMSTATLLGCGGTSARSEQPTADLRFATEQAASIATAVAAPPPEPAEVGDYRLIQPDVGWVTAAGRLDRTIDGGKTWTDITPSSTAAAGLRGAEFLDANTGWVATGIGDEKTGYSTLAIARTQDAGQHWETFEPFARGAPYLDVKLSFIDEKQGWAMATIVSSSNFSFGDLFSTVDGGATWKALPKPPIRGLMRFADARRGWLAGGASGHDLFRTPDGGEHWERQPMPKPDSGSKDARVSYDLPVFLADGTGIMMATLREPDDTASAITFRSDDGGSTWRAGAAGLTGRRFGAGVLDTAVAVTSQGHLVIARGMHDLYKSADGGASWVAVGTTGIKDGRWFGRLQFADELNAWVRTRYDVCLAPKSDCHSEHALYATHDGGVTWSEITP